MANTIWYEIGRALRQIFLSGSRTEATAKPAPTGEPTLLDARADAPHADADLASPGQFGDGATRDLLSSEMAGIRIEYSPHPDGDPDPGEVVWTWVPYVENDGRGKDRPVLIIGRLGPDAVAGCYLSTKQHRGFIPVGTGGWDSQGRESFLSPERVLRITDEGMRREGHVLAQDRFERAVGIVARELGVQL